MKNHIPVLPTRHHNLMQWSQPVIFIQKVLRVYPNEVKLLLWVTTIQLVMSSSAIQINNFAQSAFLKRFGVKSLPTVADRCRHTASTRRRKRSTTPSRWCCGCWALPYFKTA